MMSPGPLLLCLLPFSLFAQNNCPNNLCEEKIKFWLTTAKNDEKNQWIAKTGFEHSKESTREWRLQIESNCAEEEVEDVFRVAATITASCPESLEKSAEKIESFESSELTENATSSSDKGFLLDDNHDDGYTCNSTTGRYKLYSTGTQWVIAKVVCQMEGAHLAIIDSEEELAFLKQLAPERNSWLGVHDRQRNDVFVDLLGNPAKDFWDLGEPKTENGDCAALDHSIGLMYALNCKYNFSFICEKS